MIARAMPMALAAAALAIASARGAEPTWRGRPISEWVDVALVERGYGVGMASQAPWALSPKALARWEEVFARTDDPEARREAWSYLVGAATPLAQRRLIRDGLADPDAEIRRRAFWAVVEDLPGFPDLLSDVLRRASDPSEPDSNLSQFVRALRDTGTLRGDVLLAPDAAQLADWLRRLENRDESAARRAFETWSELGEPALLRAVTERGAASVPWQWIQLLGSFARRSDAAGRTLAGLLEHPDPTTLATAVSACNYGRLAERGTGLFVGPLVAIGRDTSQPAALRAEALAALGNIAGLLTHA